MIRHGRTLLLVVILSLLPGLIRAQDTPEASPAPEANPKVEMQELQSRLQQAVGRLNKVEQELRDLKLKTADFKTPPGQIPTDPEKQQLYLQLEHPYYGQTNASNNQRIKFFVANLTCLNLTEKPINISSDSLTLTVDGTEYKQVEDPKKLRNQAFQSEGQMFQLQKLSLLTNLTIQPGSARSTWVLFNELPYNQSVPDLKLTIKSDNHPPFEFSINEAAERRLDVAIEQIGPRKSLGLITVNGIVDNLSIGSLVEKVTKLTENRISRFVIRFAETGSISDASLQNWLLAQAQSAGSNAVTQLQAYPSFPVSIRELHIADLPDLDNHRTRSRTATNGTRVHATTAEAVEEALKSVYENLPRNELVEEIKTGHPFTRVVALKHGGARLMDDQLALVIDLADADDPAMQKAAIYALRHFNNETAFLKLEDLVRRNITGLSGLAIDSLAASRFGEAHQRLLSILNNEPPESKTEFVKILSQNPRPIWSETIYQFLTEETDNDYHSEALQALNRIGHPQLLDVLEKSLQNRDEEIQRIAFLILANRNDPESETLALNYTLQHLQTDPPTPEMHELLIQTKSQEAIPHLLPYLEKRNPERRNILRTLAQIGDQNVASKLTEIYPKLDTQEQAIALASLWELSSPAAVELSKQALASNEHSLMRAAINNLIEEGSEEAVALLIKSFEESNNPTSINYLLSAMEQLRTPEVKASLQRASLQGDRNKQRRAYEKLLIIWNSSPARQYLQMASLKMQEDDYEEALTDFTKAIEIDPELPTAWSGRGNAYLKLEKYKEAKDDFQKALVHDPRDQMAITGTALILVRQDDPEGAFAMLEKKEHFFEDGQLNTNYFVYNSACVYGVALELLRAKAGTEEAPENLESIAEEYETKAIEALRRSITNGFDELDWMRKDPDLNSLHDNEEFRKISDWPAAG
ncbi:TPR repeat-containing protein YrrB [Polystyrenella longa]|uniref:TPR repeat-containing protein YrrB n=1 Tax=Polystyrenella longa TaxID=2528007 RepID=A0A518CST5_9PLAN|nr:tetratricopeptide repeat protein [Polystyrenella longa]QDU82278.1 TPR repeat-containing protein YrrB [Polystyrenella longa]